MTIIATEPWLEIYQPQSEKNKPSVFNLHGVRCARCLRARVVFRSAPGGQSADPLFAKGVPKNRSRDKGCFSVQITADADSDRLK
jgi:hypothetical protein